MVQVREKSRFGPCCALGELIGETASRYIYRNRAGIAFVSKSSSIHLAPCQVCPDYQQSEGGLGHQRGLEEGWALTPTNQNHATCDWHPRPHRPNAHTSPTAREMDMLEQLAFALVAVALAAPFLAPRCCGVSSENPTKTR